MKKRTSIIALATGFCALSVFADGVENTYMSEQIPLKWFAIDPSTGKLDGSEFGGEDWHKFTPSPGSCTAALIAPNPLTLKPERTLNIQFDCAAENQAGILTLYFISGIGDGEKMDLHWNDNRPVSGDSFSPFLALQIGSTTSEDGDRSGKLSYQITAFGRTADGTDFNLPLNDTGNKEGNSSSKVTQATVSITETDTTDLVLSVLLKNEEGDSHKAEMKVEKGGQWLGSGLRLALTNPSDTPEQIRRVSAAFDATAINPDSAVPVPLHPAIHMGAVGMVSMILIRWMQRRRKLGN